MKNQKKGILLGVTFLLTILLLGIGHVQAKATTTSFETLEFLTGPPGAPEKVWVEDGTLYIRNQLFVFAVVEGDLSGIVEYCGNWNIDLATMSGVGWGSNSFIGEWVTESPYTGPVGWLGHSVIKVTGFGGPDMFVSGKYLGHGTAGFEGMLIKGIFETDPVTGGTFLSGTVLNPQG
ncbi:MAG: hypothetical protein ACFFFG_11260 [Candidatus Thorarchaeota archaeon]